MSASAKEVLKKTLTAIESETVPCERCNGYGYHHGFGEHGHDPDWCVVCGGAQVVPAHDGEKAPEILLAALSAAGFVIVPMEPTGDARAVLRYLRTQARNGTLHPQVVIQNADKVLGKQDA